MLLSFIELQSVASLSRRRHGFDSRTGRQILKNLRASRDFSADPETSIKSARLVRAMRRARQTRSILCLLVLVLSADKTSAQYQFDLWNTDKGLPQNSINAILQTKDGYLWL